MATGGPARPEETSDVDDVESDTEVNLGAAGDEDAHGGARRRTAPRAPAPAPYHALPQMREELDMLIRGYLDANRHDMTLMMAATQNQATERLIADMTRSISEGLRIGAAHMTPPPPPAPAYDPMQHRKIPPPVFKGTPGERPDAHLLRAEDWFDAYRVRDREKFREFKHTLDHLAREWYDTAVIPEDWDECKQVFSKYFSTQGRSIKHLHDRWRTFTFNPDSDDIEKFVRDVKECARQLNYDNRAILHLIKSCMPTEVYGVLYNMDDLNAVITLVKDIYAQKINHNADPSAAGATAPFTSICPQSDNGKDRSTNAYNMLDKLADTLYKFEIKDKPRKPFKPFITPPRRRGRGRGPRGRDNDRNSDRGQRSFHRGYRGSGRRGRGGQFQGRHRGDRRKFDKSPNDKKPRVASCTPDRDKDRCHRCWRFGHWQKDCKVSEENLPEKNNKGPTYDDYCRYNEATVNAARFTADAYNDALAAMNGCLDADSPFRPQQ